MQPSQLHRHSGAICVLVALVMTACASPAQQQDSSTFPPSTTTSPEHEVETTIHTVFINKRYLEPVRIAGPQPGGKTGIGPRPIYSEPEWRLVVQIEQGDVEEIKVSEATYDRFNVGDSYPLNR